MLREHADNIAALIRRWVGHAEQYGRVGYNGHMNTPKSRSIESVQWQPAERLGQLSVDAQLRPWLIGKGLLTLRLKAVCGERFALRVVDHRSGLLSGAHKSALRLDDNAGLFGMSRCAAPMKSGCLAKR